MEKTFVMLKPDCLQRGLVGAVIGRIEQKGYRVTGSKHRQLDDQFLREHYAHIANEPFFPDLCVYMLSGPVLGLCVSGEGAVAGMRRLMGPTKIEDAQPGTLRGDFASSTRYNLIHSSDSPEAAAAELKRFFGDEAVSQ